MDESPPEVRRWLRWLAPLLLALGIYGLAEASAQVGLTVLRESRQLRYLPTRLSITPGERDSIRAFQSGAGYLMPDPVLGWTVRPSASQSDAIGTYHSNRQGLRGQRLYDTIPTVTRWAAFGDSFVHGNEVADGEQWTALLESDSLEVMNFGVPGYGLDQAYLRYVTAGRVFKPGIVLIGLLPEDVMRGLSRWRPWYAGDYRLPAAKPRFVLRDSLTLLPIDTALSVLAQDDYYYRTRERAGPLDWSPTVRLGKLVGRVWRERQDGMLHGHSLRAGSEAMQLATATLDRFAADVRADGAEPVLLILPSRLHAQSFRETGQRVSQALTDHASRSGLRTVDLHDLFTGCGLCSDAFALQGHYSAAGSRLVADYVRTRLR